MHAQVAGELHLLPVALECERERARDRTVARVFVAVAGGNPDGALGAQLEAARVVPEEDHARIEAQIHERGRVGRGRGLGRLGRVAGGIVAGGAVLVERRGELHLEGEAVEDLHADVGVREELELHRLPALARHERSLLLVLDLVLEAERLESEAETELPVESRLFAHLRAPHADPIVGCARHDEAVEVEGRRLCARRARGHERRERRDGSEHDRDPARPVASTTIARDHHLVSHPRHPMRSSPTRGR